MSRDKLIKIEQADGEMHRVIVNTADVTNNGKTVICYYDLSNRMRFSYAEIINVDGVYYVNPVQHEWNYYSVKFKEHDNEFSNSIIETLPEEIEIYGKDKKTGKPIPVVVTKEKPVKEEKKTTAYFLTAIMYANRGEDLVVKDGYTNYPPLFFTRRILDEDSLTEVYKKKNIEAKDHDELLKLIDNSFKSKLRVSTVPEDLRFDVSSGNKYYINFSSCDDEVLFYEVAECDEIKVDTSLHIQSDLYEDNLSSALHHELPIEITTNNDVIAYDANSINGRKRAI